MTMMAWSEISKSVGFGFKAGYGESAKFWAKAAGSLSLGAEIKLGWDVIASLSAYAEGVIISASGQVVISKGAVTKDSGFKLTIGQLTVGIRGCLFWVFKRTLWSKVIFKGWTIN